VPKTFGFELCGFLMVVVPKGYINQRVLGIYKRIMAAPEGLNGVEHRRMVRAHIKDMSEDEISDIRGRSEEIEERGWDEYLLRRQVLLELGFADAEITVFARCRLNSPGMRTLIKERVEITRHATDAEIKRINEGDGGALSGLTMLFGKGRRIE